MLKWLDNFSLMLLIGSAVLLILLPWLWRRKHSWIYMGLFSVFWIYLLVVIGVTLLPKPHEFISAWRQPAGYILSKINLIPYIFDSSGHVHFGDRIDLIGNILLIMPFGFLFPLIVRFRRRKFLWIAFLPGLTIELSQLLISLIIGYTYRVVDITDVLTNTIGAFLGYTVFLGISGLRRGVVHQTTAGSNTDHAKRVL